MNDLQQISGALEGHGLTFGVVAARFNRQIVDRLLEGAVESLRRYGVAPEGIVVARVPGAWELPFGLATVARQRRLDGLVALGAVIRGETPHFEYVCLGCTHGCERVSAEVDLPLGFGLLTCDDTAQAAARAGGTAGNKGAEAAEAALEMARLRLQLRDTAEPGGGE